MNTNEHAKLYGYINGAKITALAQVITLRRTLRKQNASEEIVAMVSALEADIRANLDVCIDCLNASR